MPMDSMKVQHNLLSYVAEQRDAGNTKTKVPKVLSPINAANTHEAHRLVETSKAAIGWTSEGCALFNLQPTSLLETF
jgi:hypothetical protein